MEAGTPVVGKGVLGYTKEKKKVGVWQNQEKKRGQR